ncbi:DeoR/GlpR family DNA-binding transcription regulator [Chitinophaga nivalis]|uniref:DeoR/GlpR family DNA-binding transcription regulator n=1 Tax=Chitinophaga nivalis TaxID=2991709 RepID=A0ABT3IR33_9BACT|nr:DeoR/GlpR family DNA-binding transcription regulator [Chitinophaga nivalis]MCW3463872.1 DeoR/GlpR family DNA-binding transcription regulator [Chitinophaga nivalis]MCW3486438.1 DeoR/GlpR family DNA-binding transcription regulator [Chitinophaga nivalis]
MLKEERQAFIMRQINLHNKVLSTDISSMLGISEDTVRRDLKEMAEEGKILKVHGGAIGRSFHHPFDTENMVYALEAKQQIAEKTIRLLKNDMVVLTGGGTTMIELAKRIPDSLRATFFTISPLVALQLVEHTHLTVISIGGQLSKSSNVHIGASVINQLADIKVDLCLLGANGFSVQDGMTDSDWEVVQVKRAMLKASKKTAILSIAEKLGSAQRMKVCDLNLINYLITELPPENHQLADYQHLDLDLF